MAGSHAAREGCGWKSNSPRLRPSGSVTRGLGSWGRPHLSARAGSGTTLGDTPRSRRSPARLCGAGFAVHWEGAQQAGGWGPQGSPPLAAGGLNIYVSATKPQRSVTVRAGCVMGERSCLAMPKEGSGWEGSTDPSRGTGWAPRPGMAWQGVLQPSLCLLQLPAALRGAGAAGCLGSRLCFQPFAGLLSLRSSLSSIPLCLRLLRSASVVVRQHPSPPGTPVAGTLWGPGIFVALPALPRCPPRAAAGRMGSSPALCRDAAAATSAFAG